MSRSSSSSMSINRSGSKAFGMSSYSINKSGPMNRIAKSNLKEELIAKKITEIFRDKDQRMIRTIEQTIYDDKLKVYKHKRAHFEEELGDLEKERVKIIKRKKNKKERIKALRINARQQMCFLVRALCDTVNHYKILYFENDFYRLKRLLDMQKIEKNDAAKKKTVQELLNNLFHSPFKDDKRFMIRYLAIETRDRLEESKYLVDALFFDKIYKLMLNSSDEQNTLQAYDIMCNLMMNADYRAKIRDQNYMRQIYESIDLNKIDERKLEKISHMTTLIAYHSDMLPRIIECKLLLFIIKLVDPKYSVTIRSNAVLSISMLTYHEQLFQELLTNNVIDIVMNFCMDPKLELSIKSFSTLALVHFALSRESIHILLEKGIMNLFSALNTIDNAQIHTNVSWIFLALCNNGITGKQMLNNGITRDMFLVSCNPQFSQIRHLVIAGFAELGRAENLQEHSVKTLPHTLQRIKEKAIVGTQEAFKRDDAPHTIDVLLKFSLSNESAFKLTAFWALKDYILLNNDCLIDDLRGVILAFVNGAAEANNKVKIEAASAFSFLITHHLVFTEAEAEQRAQSVKEGKPEHEFNEDLCYILDALMYLTGQEAIEVRTRAFSTLSSLSTYASQNDHVMAQIQHDIKMKPNQQSQEYFSFVEDRLAQSHAAFRKKFETKNIEKDYAGLYCLMRLAQEPDEAGTEEAARYLRQFYFPDLDLRPHQPSATKTVDKGENGGVTSPMDSKLEEGVTFIEQLTEEEKRQLSVNMFNDQLDERDLVLDELNEKFFMYVFKALLYTKNRRILYQLLDVINFYIKHETPYQLDVINSETILWMLQIIDTHKDDHDLCLLAAKTVLKVVDNHQIVFDYQEMAIIKKFNKALDNIGDNNQDENSQESQNSRSSSQKEREADQNKEMISSTKSKFSIDRQAQQSDEKVALPLPLNKKLQSMPEVSILESDIKNQRKRTPSIESNKSFDSEKFAEAIDNYSKHGGSSKASSNRLDAHRDYDDKDILRQSAHDLQNIQASKTLARIEQEADTQVENILGSIKNEESSPTLRASGEIGKNRSALSAANKRFFGSTSPKLISAEDGSVAISFEQDEPLDQKKAELRDAIIKSFMVIFTNEKSQHLLLNKDIIKIAFSCLENVFQISSEAKQNLARLISIIFKFPQVQESLHNEGIILGIVYLLQNEHIHMSEIITNVVRACSYISLNYSFVNSPLSLHILKSLMPILGQLLSVQREDPPADATFGKNQPPPSSIHDKAASAKDDLSTEQFLQQRLQSQITTPIDRRRERDNCIFAISNLLKGHEANAQYFIQCNGAYLIMHEILNLNNIETNLSKEILELTMCCIKQVTEQKQVFRQFLSFSDENLNLLPACLEKCLEVSDSWHTCTSEILLFKKLFVEGEKYYEGESQTERENREILEKKLKRLDSNAILNIDYKNIEKLKMLEKLEEKEDKSFVMAPLCKLRNYCYSVATACFKSCFSQQYLIQQCNILQRIINDLKMDDLNDFIFQGLIELLRTLKKDPQAIRILFKEQGLCLIDLMYSMDSQPQKRNTLLKTLVFLVLKAPIELCTIDPAIFGKLFQMAVDIDDDEVTENILWLQAALVDINTSEEQHSRAIDLCTEFKSAHLFMRSLKSSNEVILLQALKGLKSLAAIPQFKAIILIDIGDELFPALAEILASRLSVLVVCPLEIEVELIAFLAQITESSAVTKDPLTVAAKRRAVQQGFMEHFLSRISTIDYQVIPDSDILGENCFQISNLDLVQANGLGINPHGLASSSENDNITNDEMRHLNVANGDFIKCEVLPPVDTIEREDGMNRLVENTIRLAANVTELAETQHQLVHGRGQVLLQVIALLNRLVSQCIEVESEQVDMLNYSIGNREVCNSLSKIVLNLCLSQSSEQAGAPSMQDVCVANSIGNLMVHVCRSLIDFELHSNLYRAMCLLAMSPHKQNQMHFVESECLNEVQSAAENSRFFRVRRTCNKALGQVSSELFEMNEKMNKKKRKASRKRQQATVAMEGASVNIA